MTKFTQPPLPPKIPFRMHPRVFASLGADLITSDTVAIIELVKNSYDAFATRVDVRFLTDAEGKQHIEIEDNGEGMSGSIIENVWCVVATPHRSLNTVSKKQGKIRRVSGEKGLGRLSVARLGQQLEMITKTRNGPCWQVSVDWSGIATAEDINSCGAEVAEYEEKPPFKNHGTLIRVYNLNADWDSLKLLELRKQLSRLVSPFEEIRATDFRVFLTLSEKEAEPMEIEPPDYFSHPPYKIKGHVYNSGFVACEYFYSDFSKEKKRKIKEQIWHGSEYGEEKSNQVPTCGAFDFEIRAWDRDAESVREIAEYFEINKSSIRKDLRNLGGIYLYRDGILVLPKSDEARDWMGLDIRRVSKLGTRLSTSQIVGYVSITAKENPEIKDTSDRERLVDNDAVKDFVRLIKGVIRVFEYERDKDRQEESHKEPPFKDLFAALRSDRLVGEVSKMIHRGSSYGEILSTVEEYSANIQETVGQVEKRLIYYSRLASIGTLAAIIVHEVRNHAFVIEGLVLEVRKLLDKAEPSVQGIAEDLKLAERSLRSLKRIADRFAPLASRAFGTRRRNSILEDIIQECLSMREKEISSRKISTDVHPLSHTEVVIDPGELIAVIINLIDNAIFWLLRVKDRERRLEFHISKNKKSNRVKVEVHDSGPGITEDDKERVFWPGVTKKPEGLGMGLTVASEIIAQRGGRMYLVDGPGHLGGASFGFDLPMSIKEK